MDIGKILSKAWKTIWKHKILWLFGILAGCGAAGSRGGGGGGSSAMSSNGGPGTWDRPPFMNPGIQRAIEDFFRSLSEIPPIVWVLIVLGLIVVGIVMSILFLMAGTLGTAGVIKGTGMAEEGDEASKPISFGAVFNAIKPYYWKVFLLNLGLRIVGFLVLIFLGLPLILLTVCTCFLGLFLLVPLGWFIDLMVNFTTIAIIEEDKGIFEGIERAWQIITKNIGNVFVMFLILGVGQLIAGLIIALPLVIAPAPLLINLFASGFRTVTIGLIISIVLFLIFIPLVILLTGMLKAYVLTGWTLTYRQLTAETMTVLSEEPQEE